MLSSHIPRFAENTWRDLRFAVRVLLRQPAFTSLVTLSLALGIGANIAVFSLVDGILLHPLPVPHPQQIVDIDTAASKSTRLGDSSYLDYVDFRDKSKSFAGISLYRRVSVGMNPVTTSQNVRPEVVWGLLVSGNYFSTFQVKPAIGRVFRPDEDAVPDRNPVVIISYGLWKRDFAGALDAVGKSVRLNGHSFTVIGIMPKDFFSADIYYRADIYVPTMMSAAVFPDGQNLLHNRLARRFRIRARLRPGATVAQAQTEMNVIMQDLAREYPETNKETIAIVRTELGRRIESDGIALPTILMALVVLVLLIACANIANLSTAKATSRSGDIATQLAIGATRTRLVSQFLAETFVLAIAGGTFGIVLGYSTVRAARNLLPYSVLPQSPEFQMDARVWAYAFLVLLTAIFLCGLLPAVMMTRESAGAALRTCADARTNRSFGLAARQFIIAGQVVFSVVLLIAAGLCLKSFSHARNFDIGFNANNVSLVTVDLGLYGYSSERTKDFYQHLLERVTTLPGVKSVALSAVVPFASENSWDLSIDDYVAPQGDRFVDTATNRISPRYFATMQIPILEGREFNENDKPGMPEVAIVNEELARRFIIGNTALSGAIGHILRLREGKPIQIVGIVKNSAYGADTPIGSDVVPVFYLPALQAPQFRMVLNVRTQRDLPATNAGILQAIHDLDTEVTPLSVVDLSTVVYQNGLFSVRVSALLSGVFGLIGLALAVIGVYGVVSFAVRRRTREIGIRIALGAMKSDILKMILLDSASPVVIGMAIGVGGSLIFTPLMKNLLVNVSPWDPLTLVAVPLALFSAAFLGSWIPARRAMDIEPLSALRYE